MKNIKKIIFFFTIIFLFSGCNTLRKGFEPNKRSGEEFLVEKKSPLEMPPSYNELPVPKQKNMQKSDRKSDVRSLVIGSKNREELEEANETISSIEKLILKEIKKN